MQNFSYIIQDDEGIHARPAGDLVKLAKQFTSSVQIGKDGKNVDCKKIFGIMATKQLNSEIGYAMRDTLQKRRIRFLVDEADGRKELSYVKDFDTFSPELKGALRQPYLQSTALVSEMIELEFKIAQDTNLLSLSEKSGMRKDRYSSVSYANYYANILERQLFTKKDIYEEGDDFIGFYQF